MQNIQHKLNNFNAVEKQNDKTPHKERVRDEERDKEQR